MRKQPNRIGRLVLLVALALAVPAGLPAQPQERERGAPGNEEAGGRPAGPPGGIELPERAREAVEAGADAAAGAAERARRGVERSREALERQMARFEDIHARRMAQLNRLHELGEAGDRPDVLERVGELIERETERYNRQISRLRERMEDRAADPEPAEEPPADPEPAEEPETDPEPVDAGETGGDREDS